MLSAYIAYIQITLREAKLTNSSLLECPLNRSFDQATKSAVIKFQQEYKINKNFSSVGQSLTS